jgi:hypothetical protein
MGWVAVIALVGAVTVALGGLVAILRGRLRLALGLQAAGMAVLGVAGMAALTSGHDAGAAFRSDVSPASPPTAEPSHLPLIGHPNTAAKAVAPRATNRRPSIPPTAEAGYPDLATNERLDRDRSTRAVEQTSGAIREASAAPAPTMAAQPRIEHVRPAGSEDGAPTTTWSSHARGYHTTPSSVADALLRISADLRITFVAEHSSA